MISAIDLLKRFEAWRRLVPFFKCVGVYFLAGGGAGGAAPSLVAVTAKCAPVLCLLILVALHHRHHKGRYVRRISAGLALSALGDALLLWPQHFVAGMAAFALAHLAYLAAFRLSSAAPAVGAALYAATGLYLRCVSPPGALRLLVPLYSLLLATMTWRAVARALVPDAHTSRRAALSAAAGALLFLISDAILGYSMFGGDVPYNQAAVMCTYYLGQLGIALSALETRGRGPSPHAQ